MKNKKEFLGILISVLICVFVFGIIVYATTTIGNDVTVGGVLTVSSTASSSFAGDLDIEGDINIGNNTLRIDTSGKNIGIGTIEAPGRKLDIELSSLTTDGQIRLKSAFGYDINTSTDARKNVGTIEFFSNDVDAQVVVGKIQAIAEGNHSGSSEHKTGLAFSTSPSGSSSIAEVMRISAAGNVGIGDAVPSYTLSVDGTASVSGTTYLSDTYFSGVVSASDTGGILVGEGAKITAGTASPSGACGTAGSLYIRTGQTGVDTVLNICDSDGLWNPTDL